jgi:DNA-binding response OmpR family regulator
MEADEQWLLLVEDSPADVYLVQEAVRQEGLRFDWKVAEDGEAALEIIDQVDENSDLEAPRLLLLDINVPRKSGNHVLEHLRRSPRCHGVPVVMISSSDSPAERQRAFDLGANEYFRKPSSLDEFMKLGAVVRRHVSVAAQAVEVPRRAGAPAL